MNKYVKNRFPEGTDFIAGKFLSVEDAAKFLGFSLSYFRNEHNKLGMPPFIKLGKRVLYDAYELIDWIDNTNREIPGTKNQRTGEWTKVEKSS